VDTPGVRQLQLWDTIPEEVEGYFQEFRPFVALCAFPDCTHTHETGCGVKSAVARRLVSDRRAMSVALTAEGAELAQRVFPTHADRVSHAFAALDEDEKRSLASICRKLAA